MHDDHPIGFGRVLLALVRTGRKGRERALASASEFPSDHPVRQTFERYLEVLEAERRVENLPVWDDETEARLVEVHDERRVLESELEAL